MAETDKELGRKIHELMEEKGVETPMVRLPIDPHYTSFDAIKCNHASTMRALGLNLEDDSLKDTPKRIAKMYCNEIFTGLNYDHFPKCTVIDNKMHYDEMVSVKAVVKSMCEHHFMPIMGTAYIAYIPDELVIGLSKFNRVVDFFARRPQVQERLTEQISLALQFILQTRDVAVVIKAEHFCVAFRGVQDTSSITMTSKMSGKFRQNDITRQEFLAIVNKENGS